METKMLNKKIILTFLLIVSSNILADKIIGIGQVGDKFIYKINGVLASLSVGDVVSGCLVQAGSGLQCNESFNGTLENKFAIETLQDKLIKLKTIEELSNENKSIKSSIEKITKENVNLETELTNTKSMYIAKINKRNKIINNLSDKLNSKN
jgi:predicted RNase H-like nuclease (RuvC/YqgF family)